MRKFFYSTLFIVSALGCAASLDSGRTTPLPARSVELSILQSLEFLRRDGDRWLRGESPIQEGSACVSCHHVGFTLWSHEEALRAGIDVEDQARLQIADIRKRTLDFLSKPDRPRVVSVTQLMMADSASQELESFLIESRQPEGHWRARGQFPSQRRGEKEGDAANSLWALAALQRQAESNREALPRLEEARRWLANAAPGSSNEWFAAKHAVIGQATSRDDLWARQNEDGGWGWMEHETSNAFSTAQALYALSLHPTADEAAASRAQRAIDWLLQRQAADGSWSVESSLVSEAPSEAKQEIYQYWSTAWACIALSRSLRSVALEVRS